MLNNICSLALKMEKIPAKNPPILAGSYRDDKIQRCVHLTLFEFMTLGQGTSLSENHELKQFITSSKNYCQNLFVFNEVKYNH